MASPSVPTHGKLGALYRLRPNGFLGVGLNDVTWGTAATNAATAYYEVEIMTEGAPDKYKWRKNGGAWDDNTGAGYSITGAAQTLDEAQTITFAATTGHTLADKWVIGNLKDEATTESGADAQITAAGNRILNPNAPPTFTDDGSANVLITNYTIGQATFDANVGIVDVDGNNGYIPAVALEQVGYLIDWNFNVALAMADASRMGQKWSEALPGMANANGGATGYFIGGKTPFEVFPLTQKYHFLKLFSYDPDDDGTGDHFLAWVTFTNWSLAPTLNEVVKENINFQVFGIPSRIENT